MREISLTSERRTQLIDITERVREALDGAAGAAVLVYVPHTTAGVTINEKIDPDLVEDLERAFEQDRRGRLGLGARRQGRPERPVARPRVGRRARRCSCRCATARSALGRYQAIFLLRVRRAEGALGLRQRPPVGRASVPSPRSARPGARAPDRLARLRRERRRAARRLRRLRARGAAGRHGARARDEGAAPPRRGGHDRGARAGAAAGRGAVRPLPGLRRLPLPGSRLRGAARGEAGVGRRLAAADRRHRRAAARADRRRRGGLPLPQQDGVLVRARTGGARRSACTAPAAGTRCSRSSAAG